MDLVTFLADHTPWLQFRAVSDRETIENLRSVIVDQQIRSESLREENRRLGQEGSGLVRRAEFNALLNRVISLENDMQGQS